MIHVGWAVAGLGMGLAYAAHAQAVLRNAPAERYGASTASMQLLDNLGVALGTGAVGIIVTTGDDLGWDPGRTVALALIGPVTVALLGAVLSRRFPTAGEGSSQRPIRGGSVSDVDTDRPQIEARP